MDSPRDAADENGDEPIAPFDETPEDPEPLDPEHPFFTHEPIASDGETRSVTDVEDYLS
jgi:hypothetical protein